MPVQQFSDVQDYKRELGRKLKTAWKVVGRRVIEQQEKQKDTYDQQPNIEQHEFEEGDLVLVWFPKPPTEAAKFYAPWRGPFRVQKIRRPVVTVIGLEKKEEWTIHMDCVKKFIESRQLPLRKHDIREEKEGTNMEERTEMEEQLQEQLSSKRGRKAQESNSPEVRRSARIQARREFIEREE
jgi:hypothetical protein